MASPFIDGASLADLLAAFVAEHPAARVRVRDMHDESAASAMIEEGRCEFVVTHLGTLDARADGLEVITLGEQEFWLVCPPGTDLPDGPIDIADLPRIPMVFVPRGGSVADEIESAMREAGVRPPVAVLAEHREERLPMVLAGVGATLLERRVAESFADRATVRPVRPRFVRSLVLMYDPTALSAAAQAFLAIAQRVACLLYTSPSPRDLSTSRMPSSA